MSAMEDLKWLMLVLLGLFIAWIIFGSRGGIGLGPFLNPPSPLGDGGTYGSSIGQGNTREGGSDNGSGNGTTGSDSGGESTPLDLNDLKGEVKKIMGLANSQYKGKIEISSSSGAKQTSAEKERIEIRVGKDVVGKIPITNWRIESGVSGVGDSIDEGVYLPYSGRVNVESHIFVEAGDKIIISTGRSPIGVSFRLNKCTGYFEQFQDFDPQLPRSCPKPIDDLPNQGAGDSAQKCIDFVERLPRCEVYVDEIPLDLSGSCQEYLTSKINYNTCVDIHKDERGFYLNEWRVFFGRKDELWKNRREIIKLLDHEGKVVDAITY